MQIHVHKICYSGDITKETSKTKEESSRKEIVMFYAQYDADAQPDPEDDKGGQ